MSTSAEIGWSPVLTLSSVVPAPYVALPDANKAAGWWPSCSEDPRRTVEWAQGTRRPDDGIAFIGTGAGPALWVRLADAGRAPPRQDAVEVCGGVVSGIPYDHDLVARSRATCRRQLVAAANGYVSPLISSREVTHHELLPLIEAVVGSAERVQAVPAFLNCTADDPLLGPLRENGFVTGVTDLYAGLDLPGNGFDDYLAALPGRNRRSVRRERRQLASAKARIYVGEESSARIDDASALVAEAYANRGQHRDPVDLNDSYRCLLSAFGENFLLCMVDVEGAPVASACMIVGRGDLLVYSAGLRQPEARAVAGYFNATYYLPIDFAYSRGIRHVLLGPTGVKTKALRGATFSPMLSAVPRWCEPLVRSLESTDAAMRAELARLAGR